VGQLTRERHGDGYGHLPFGHRELAPGLQRLTAERLIPERLTAVAVTRHPKLRHRHKKAPVIGG